MSMPARRRKTTASKTTATAAAAPPVTQVVEVVEDVPAIEEPPIQEPPVEESSATTKSMVEELYTPEEKPTVMPEISMHTNSAKKPLIVWALVTIIVAVLTGSILFAVSRKSTTMPSFFTRPTPTPTPAPTPTPTPTPAVVDKTSFKIKVLNGSGTPGAAGKMKTLLEDKGYEVSSTGNTEDYTYTSTEIHGKSTMTDAIANLKADLKSSYTIGTVAADLDASASSDVHVIVGKE